MANRKPQSDHDKMVQDSATWLSKNKYSDVKADVPGYTSPSKITWESTGKGHIPDISAISNSSIFIFEVETDDSIDDEHTKDQWKLFSAHAKNIKGEFWVVVPKSSTLKAEKRLDSLKLTGKVWGI